ncbi:MAG: hypothetical protein J6M34_06730 [Clostridia bacterium]|nr:hypothetical protein [Clostridia bacterium]
MKKITDRIFGSPHYLPSLLFAAKVAAAAQFFAALFFAFLSQRGGPLGCLEASRIFWEAGAVTLTLAATFELTAFFLRRIGIRF